MPNQRIPQLTAMLLAKRPRLEDVDYSDLVGRDEACLRGMAARRFAQEWLARCPNLKPWNPGGNGFRLRTRYDGTTIYEDDQAVCTLDYFLTFKSTPMGFKVHSGQHGLNGRSVGVALDVITELGNDRSRLVILTAEGGLPPEGVFDGNVYRISMGYSRNHFGKVIERIYKNRL